MTEEIERDVAHRPWPLPDGPWIMFQSWRNQLFAHWRMSASEMRTHVPTELELDLYEGDAWLGLTPFLITGLHVRGLPTLPVASEFPELNLRTYVTVGGKPGVFFFSLDAGSQLAVLGARASFGLPYHHADMSITAQDDGWTRYESRRTSGDAELLLRYRPTSETAFHAKPGTLDHFLTERYALYVVRGANVVRGDIHHRPWSLQRADAVFENNTIAAASGLALPSAESVLHYSQRQDALIWPPVTVG